MVNVSKRFLRYDAFHNSMYELTLPAGIELSVGEEEKALENLFFAFGKVRRLCYSHCQMILKEKSQRANKERSS